MVRVARMTSKIQMMRVSRERETLRSLNGKVNLLYDNVVNINHAVENTLVLLFLCLNITWNQSCVKPLDRLTMGGSGEKVGELNKL